MSNTGEDSALHVHVSQEGQIFKLVTPGKSLHIYCSGLSGDRALKQFTSFI